VLLPTGLLLDAGAEDADYARWYACVPVEELVRTSHRIRILLNLDTRKHPLLDRAPHAGGAHALLAKRAALEQERGWIQKRLGTLAAEPYAGPHPRRPGSSGVPLKELPTEDLEVERWILNHALGTNRERAAERYFSNGRYSSKILATPQRPGPRRGCCYHPDPMEVHRTIELEDGRFEHRTARIAEDDFPRVHELHAWRLALDGEARQRICQPGMIPTAFPGPPPIPPPR